FRRLADRVYGWRDGLLTSPRFRDWALGNPLTRRIAQRNVSDLFDLCASFVYTQILFASVRLNLFEILRPGPLSLEDLSQRLDLPLEGTERLL
ncbi:methyltransferase dimerization domain-containing protein, partial [Streptomyces scabiei]|uniref:methyltransferase family protein n=1 Tax=Streptomyces scabiei TaxID=1930 RepID=UPI0038F68800